MKLSNMLPGVVSKRIRDYFLPIFDHFCFVFYNSGQRRRARLYPSRCRLRWELFIFSNQWLECLTKYKK